MKDERLEKIAEAVHNAWWQEKIKQGVVNHPDMLPYNELSEKVKEYDRVTARAVLHNLPELQTWIPVSERLPEDSKYILLSFSNFSLPAVGRYEKDEEGGAFYLGDCDEKDTCVANDLFVNAWMPLPEPYRPEPEEGI